MTSDSSIEKRSLKQSLLMIIRSKSLRLRFGMFVSHWVFRLFLLQQNAYVILLLIPVNCCYQWMAGCFGYYVLSLSSTQIPGANRYVSFIFTMAIEIPGNILAQLLLQRMNRRRMLPMMICIAATSIVISPFIPKEYSTTVLLLFLVGKASMTCAYTSMFVFTAELWPTNVRTTIMNTCLAFARIGSGLAPFTVIMVCEVL